MTVGPTFIKAEPKGAPAPKRKASAPARTSTRSLKTEIGAALVQINLIFLVSPFRDDALDDAEILALATAIDDQAKRSPAFRKMVERALTASDAAGLVGIVGMIAARRLARHGRLPAQLDPFIGAILGAGTGQIVPGRTPFEAPVDNTEDRPIPEQYGWTPPKEQASADAATGSGA